MEAAAQERRSVVASGKTVDDAIANGLAMLGVRRDQVDTEVLTEGSRGILGLGAENARVRLLVKAPPPPQAAAPEPEPPLPAPRVEPQTPAETPTPAVQLPVGAPALRVSDQPSGPPPPGGRSPRPEPEGRQPAKGRELATVEPTPDQLGQQLLTELLRRMGISAKVEVASGADLADAESGQSPPIVLNITGGDLGILIGRRGETLRALQYLVRLMVSHRLKQWTDLVVDVEHYRIRRRRQLESLAQSMAERVAREGRSVALEPMPPYERRIVHMALRKHPKVTTLSVGEGERRKVTILPRR